MPWYWKRAFISEVRMFALVAALFLFSWRYREYWRCFTGDTRLCSFSNTQKVPFISHQWWRSKCSTPTLLLPKAHLSVHGTFAINLTLPIAYFSPHGLIPTSADILTRLLIADLGSSFATNLFGPQILNHSPRNFQKCLYLSILDIRR